MDSQLKEEAWKLAETQNGLSVVSVFKTLNERDPVHLDFCLGQLSSTNAWVRMASASALGSTRPVQPKTVVALLNTAHDPTSTLGERSLTLLLPLVENSGVPDDLRLRCVQLVLDRGDDDQQWTALEILDRLGTNALSALPQMLALLRDDNPRLRSRAATSLGQLGLRHPAILDALLHLRNDAWEFVQEAVESALVQLGQATQPAPSDPFPQRVHVFEDYESDGTSPR